MNSKWRSVLYLSPLKYSKSCSNFIKTSKSLVSIRNSKSITLRPNLYHTHSAQRVDIPIEKEVLVVENNSNTSGNENDPGGNEADNLKSLKYSLVFLGISLTTIGSFLFMTFGSPRLDSVGNVIQDVYSGLPIWKQYICRCLGAIRSLTLFIQEPSREKLLPDPLKPPYHQPRYTLILELTNVLVHPEWTYSTGWRFKKRPGLDHLLESLSGLFEIVIFTAEQGVVAFPLCEALDPKNLISYKLVRDGTHFVNGHHVKNLDKLNRDLSKVIVVDYNDESVKFHRDNLFNIGSWDGNDDLALVDLTSFLVTIAKNDVEDVREVLRYYKSFEKPLATFRQKQKELFEMERESIPTTHSRFRKSYFY